MIQLSLTEEQAETLCDTLYDAQQRQAERHVSTCDEERRDSTKRALRFVWEIILKLEYQREADR